MLKSPHWVYYSEAHYNVIGVYSTEGVANPTALLHSSFVFLSFISTIPSVLAVTLGMQQSQDVLGQKKSTEKRGSGQREEENGEEGHLALRVKRRMWTLIVRGASFAWTAKRQKKMNE